MIGYAVASARFQYYCFCVEMDPSKIGSVMQYVDVFFDISLNKPLNTQSGYQWFETP